MYHFPTYVKQTLSRLNTAGFLAFVVGGAVRDMCLGKTPVDFDIATNATPTETEALFPKTLSFGKKHGTITVLTDAANIEVTSFREDGSYHNHRQPESVLFVGDLHSDLSRRDFTINAMAMDIDGNIIDPFDGQSDLSLNTIRTVGCPNLRFSEDALRLLRAVRFSAQLGFYVECDTWAAIQANAALAKTLSAERIRDEVEKILLSSNPAHIEHILKLGLLDGFLGGQVTDLPYPLTILGQLDAEKSLRWIGFLYAAGLNETVLQNLRLDKKTITLTKNVLALLHKGIATDKFRLKQQLYKYTLNATSTAIRLEYTFHQADKQQILDEILTNKEPYQLSHLALSGADLLTLGFASGKQLGKTLQTLLGHVMEFPEDNTREKLLEIIKLKQQ